MKPTNIRFARIGAAVAGIPALVVGLAWSLRQTWSSRLPDTVAIHWGGEGVDRGASLDVFATWTLGASGVLTVVFAALVVAGLRRGLGVTRAAAAFAAWLAAMPTLCLIGSMWATLDVSSWEQAAGAGRVVALVLGGSVVAAALGALVAGPGVPRRRPAGARSEGPSLGLAPGERATWVGGTTNTSLAIPLMLLIPALLLVTALLTGSGAPMLGYALAAAVSVLVALAISRLRVVVDSTGVTVRMGAFGLPRRHVPLGDIAGADVERLGVLSAGGFGVRVNPVAGYTAYKIRGGPALALRLRSGHKVLITVDRPAQAAGLVNDLVGHDSPNPA